MRGTSFSAGAPSRAAGAGPAAGPVILIDWDGVDPGYLDRHLDSRLPHLRSLAAAGVRGVASCTYKAVSNPNRASLATGARPAVHGNAAYVLHPATGRATGQTRRLAAETLAQSLRRQGRTVLAAGWYIVWSKGAAYGDPGALYTQGATWEENVETVVRALRGRPVRSGGRRLEPPRPPDLIAAYAADIDAIGHREGPWSGRIPPRLAELDAGLGRILDAARAAGARDRAAFVVVSDHGMTGYTHSLEPRVLEALAEAGFSARRLHSGHSPDPGTEVVLTASPRTANVYLRGGAATEEGRARVEAMLRGLPELEGVRNRAELEALGAAPAEGDFTIEARPPYAFVDPARADGRERGGHSSLREGRAPLILSGAGIAPGRRLDAPRIIDVAPTISHLLGVRAPSGAEGRVLTEALLDTPP
ncbi:alkaline phosphatase family protein [Allosalinactinospora lopnorensis]|uniref:alkaline phosphatase family protein n=1 Tax=Allosalinactinospora lopnorensis TaxID=1352348 RepID=UPI0009E31313|nr:alkaline phosphatase family protein [Allosalinactinospora lopnorensis]